MITINQELFEQYYQNKYDFNTSDLSKNDIAELKQLAQEKRYDYARAPLGTGIFNWIVQQNNDIRIELIDFISDKIDGLLYIPRNGKERAYIVLNANKPLVNQIFTAAHEYYHYIKDYRRFKENPYVCDLSALKDVNEKKASRFAAELLLPEEALKQEVNNYCIRLNLNLNKKNEITHFAILGIYLTIKYQMPLKAVLYRFSEENYIVKPDAFLANYGVIKQILLQLNIFKDQVDELYSIENKYVKPYGLTYQNMEQAFLTGYASKEDIIADAKKLNMDMKIINDILMDEGSEDEDSNDEGDERIVSMIRKHLGGEK